MSVSIEREIAIDLLHSRLKIIRDTIEDILNQWNQSSVEVFLEKSRHGSLPESEMDGITIEQLVHDLAKYEQLLDHVS